MSNDTMKKIARELAETATRTEKQADLQSVLSNPYLQNAALGAGAGGLLGLVSGKNKRRAMLDYALMGGLGGLGATAAKDMLFKKAPPPPEVAKAWGEDNSVVGPAVGVGAMGAGGAAGSMLHNAIDQYGKLDRAMDMRANKTVADALRPMRDILDGDAQGMAALKASLGDKEFAQLQAMHARSRPASAFGTATRESTNLLSRAANNVLNRTPSAYPGVKPVSGQQLRAALARVPKVRGRFALPVMGALAVPALWNALTSAKAE